jgi:hypothetical protein
MIDTHYEQEQYSRAIAEARAAQASARQAAWKEIVQTQLGHLSDGEVTEILDLVEKLPDTPDLLKNPEVIINAAIALGTFGIGIHSVNQLLSETSVSNQPELMVVLAPIVCGIIFLLSLLQEAKAVSASINEIEAELKKKQEQLRQHLIERNVSDPERIVRHLFHINS